MFFILRDLNKKLCIWTTFAKSTTQNWLKIRFEIVKYFFGLQFAAVEQWVPTEWWSVLTREAEHWPTSQGENELRPEDVRLPTPADRPCWFLSRVEWSVCVAWWLRTEALQSTCDCLLAACLALHHHNLIRVVCHLSQSLLPLIMISWNTSHPPHILQIPTDLS